MTSKDDTITALTERYHEAIGDDHHKDKDCHFYIEKKWSYGAPPIYTAAHYGYLSKFEKQCASHGEAQDFIIERLQKMIADRESWTEPNWAEL